MIPSSDLLPPNVIPTLYALLISSGYPVGLNNPEEMVDIFHRRGLYRSRLMVAEFSVQFWLDNFKFEIWEQLNAYHTEQLRRRYA